MRIIDLSVSIRIKDKGELEPASIQYLNHKKGGDILGLAGCVLIYKTIFSKIKNLLLYILCLKKITHKDFPQELGLAWEKINLSTHCGTHLDSPYHYGPICDEKNSLTVENMPLEYCYSDGVVLDLRNKKTGETITIEDLEAALKKINYQLKPKDIVLIMTGRDKFLHDKTYPFSHPGISREALDWLINRKIKIIGIDAWSIDRPINFMIKDYLKTKDENFLWPAHIRGREKEFFHIEKLANLDKIPAPYGFKIACFPISIEKASAGWCRALAIIE